MSTEVVMPQMGESIAEGTITRWIKQVGERVERDEPLFEISTDKVDAEIPSPAAGVLTEIKFKEGETVEVNKVVAIIGDGGSQAAAPSAPQAEATPAPAPAAQAAVAATPPPQPATAAPSAPIAPPPAPARPTPPAAVTAPQPTAPSAQSAPASAGGNGGAQTVEELRRTKSSPLVRNIAKEHGIDISQLEGTGASGRVTKNDILSYIESGAPAPSSGQAAQAQVSQPAT
jgi:pyruvate dehydrogenase E2 component (dihydrolipoamide acetyltransferase)